MRLLGVDAPETAVGRGSAECYGVEATDATRGILPRGARIVLRTDATQGREDRFGRLLAEVALAGDTRTVNESLVASGSAKVFRGDGRGAAAARAAPGRARGPPGRPRHLGGVPRDLLRTRPGGPKAPRKNRVQTMARGG